MEVTIDNYDKIIPENDQPLMMGLILDLLELNQELEDNQEQYRQMYIDYQDYHDEYSPERVDPCPDYYGTYTLRLFKDPYNKIGVNMNLDELDTVLCTLCNFVETKLS